MKRLVQKYHLKNGCIIGSFIVISILEVILLIICDKYEKVNDNLFHIKRILGLIRAIQSGSLFPHFNFWTMDRSGSAIFTFYPYLTIWPLAVILAMLKCKATITEIYLLYAAMFLLCLCCSYYSSKGIFENTLSRYTFAIVYSSSEIIIMNIVMRVDVGAMFTCSLLPLVLFGIIKLIRRNKWKELAIGITLIAYSHILGLMICTLITTILVIINIKQFMNKDKIKALIKLVVTVILLSAYQTIPIIYLLAKNKILMPNVIGNPKLHGETWGMLPIKLGALAIIGIIVTGINIKKLQRIDKQIFCLGIIFVILASSLIPWNVFQNTPLKVIQFPSRLLVVPNIIFIYLVAKIIVSSSKKHLMLKAASLILVALLIEIGNQGLMVNKLNSNKALRITSTMKLNNGVQITNKNDKPISHQNNYTMEYINNNKGLSKFTQAKWLYVFNQDYLTLGNRINNSAKQSKFWDIASNNQSIINHKLINFDNEGNGKLLFKLTKPCRRLIVPIDIYNGANYHVKLNGKPVRYSKDKNNQLSIKNVKSDKNTIQISNSKNAVDYISAGLSIAGLVLLIILKGRKRYDNQN